MVKLINYNFIRDEVMLVGNYYSEKKIMFIKYYISHNMSYNKIYKYKFHSDMFKHIENITQAFFYNHMV